MWKWIRNWRKGYCNGHSFIGRINSIITPNEYSVVIGADIVKAILVNNKREELPVGTVVTLQREAGAWYLQGAIYESTLPRH